MFEFFDAYGPGGRVRAGFLVGVLFEGRLKLLPILYFALESIVRCHVAYNLGQPVGQVWQAFPLASSVLLFSLGASLRFCGSGGLGCFCRGWFERIVGGCCPLGEGRFPPTGSSNFFFCWFYQWVSVSLGPFYFS